MKKEIVALVAFSSLMLGAICPLQAQWLTQSVVVKPGWSAIYLHVDASYQSLDNLVGNDPSNPIVEIWRWQSPATTVQFITSPATPLTTSSDWGQWSRAGSGVPITFQALTPNTAYLVHSSATTNYTWRVKGKPIAPLYNWTTSGLNFIGFPTAPGSAPRMDTFLSLAPALSGGAEIYQYPGGELGPANPSPVVLSLHPTSAARGQAFWVRAGEAFNDYFGPFQVSLSSSGEIPFGDAGSLYTFHLRNTTLTNVTVSLLLVASETPPPGQTAIAGLPPILLRGALNTTNLTYAYTTLSSTAPQTWALPPKGQPGSDITVVIGVNRNAMAANPGAYYAGILRFTDSFGFLQTDVSVSAKAATVTGLWVGNAAVTLVGNYLKSYQVDTNHHPIISANGNYVVTNIDTSLGSVVQSFPLRLILHNDGTNVYLLQRVFYGKGISSNMVVATTESALDPAQLATARRITAVTLPWSPTNNPWPCSGILQLGGTLSTTVALPYDDAASNPFVHSYHPDHDNLDATFKQQLPRGAESYDITRQITLKVDPVNDDFTSLTHLGQTFSGTYNESVTLASLGSASRVFNVRGNFSLTHISSIATLTQH